MLIWLIDYDGKMENMALMRLAAHHKAQGDTVRLKAGDAYPELFETPDRVYISALFRWNYTGAMRLADAWGDRAVIGGTGIDPTRKLPEYVNGAGLDYSLYDNQRAVGFISRGCIRNCPWCVVPRKEGWLHRVATAQQIVGDFKEAVFLDNNFLALPDYADDLRWLAANQIAIDFNQGLDARLVTEESAALLAACLWKTPGKKTVRLALDSDGQMGIVEHAVDRLEAAGIARNTVFIYCLIGYWGFESDVRRLLFLHDQGVNAFPMGYRDLETGKEPAKGWDRRLYNKFRRLIIRMPFAESVWQDFKREVEG